MFKCHSHPAPAFLSCSACIPCRHVVHISRFAVFCNHSSLMRTPWIRVETFDLTPPSVHLGSARVVSKTRVTSNNNLPYMCICNVVKAHCYALFINAGSLSSNHEWRLSILSLYTSIHLYIACACIEVLVIIHYLCIIMNVQMFNCFSDDLMALHSKHRMVALTALTFWLCEGQRCCEHTCYRQPPATVCGLVDSQLIRVHMHNSFNCVSHVKH